MRPRTHLVKLLALAVLCPALIFTASAQDGSWQRDLASWRAQHVADLLKPDGWLSLAGLEWLQPGDNSFGTATDNKIHVPGGDATHLGVLHLENDEVTLLPPPGGFPQELLLDGAPAKSQTLRVVPGKDKLSQHLTIGTLNMYAIKREARFALRIKDSKSPALTGFHGLNWFEPNAAYRVTAKWIPYNPPKTITLSTLIGTTYEQPVPGVAEFTLSGKPYRLEPVFEDPEQPKLFFILRDTTSATTTYGACRFLYTGFPTNGLDKPGELVLDFNHLENPPCAYTAFATCPLPPPGNRLPIALPVGEKRYHD
jgi:uncharacterized protein (DUF1684 family)